MHDQPSLQHLTVVVIDDNPGDLRLIEMALREAEAARGDLKLRVETYDDPVEALASLSPVEPTVVLCDYRMPSGSGIDWLGDILRSNPVPVILITGAGDDRIATQAFRSGASDYLLKPAMLEDPVAMLDAISEAMRRFTLEHRIRELTRRLKLVNTELERKNKDLAELTEVATRFVEDVSHEFRTPLAVIKEFTSIISDGIGGTPSPAHAEYLQFISEATDSLTGLVEDFLDSSKLRAKTLRVDRRPHTVGELLGPIRPIIEKRAAVKSIRIEEDLGDCSLELFADVEKVRRVLVNLVVNAVKFSPAESTVTISARAAGTDLLEISVADEGPGVAPEEMQTIFERFEQTATSRHATAKGFGLGLGIAMDLVRLNLGTMDVGSAPERGSVFRFTLPRADHRSIVRQYVERRSVENPTGVLAAIVLTPTGWSADVEPLRAFLCSMCQPTDLVLAEEQRIILVGLTQEPDRWIGRLLDARNAEMTRDPDGALDAFTAEVAGSWLASHALEPVCSIVALENASHAEVRPRR